MGTGRSRGAVALDVAVKMFLWSLKKVEKDSGGQTDRQEGGGAGGARPLQRW